MKNMKKLIAMMLMMASVLFFACDKDDDDDKPLNPEEAKKEITQLSTDMSTYITQMEEADGMVAFEDFLGLTEIDDPFTAGKSASSKSLTFNKIKRFLTPDSYVESTEKSALEGDRFDFNLWVGTYEWDAAHQMWIPAFEQPSDKIIINFPTEGSNTNNATLTIHNYVDTEIIEEDGMYTYSYYQPTEVKADLYVNNIKLVDVNLMAEWDTYGDPKTIDASVYLIPFEFTVDFGMTTTAADVNVAIYYEDAKIFSAGVGATFQNSLEDEMPININGYLQVLKVKFEIDVNVLAIEELFMGLETGATTMTDPEEFIAAINEEIDAVVLVDGVKAADIELAMVTTTTSDMPFDIVFVYSDGSTESAIPYFEALGTELDGFFYDLSEYYDNWK